MKSPIFAIWFMVLAASVSSGLQAEQLTTSTVTIAAAYSVQEASTTTGAVTKYAAYSAAYTTKNLVAQMAKSYSSIKTNGAILQAVSSDTSEDIKFQVKSTNGSFQNVSKIVKFTGSTNTIESGNYNNATGKADLTVTAISTIAYDDTIINHINGLRFSYSGAGSSSIAYIPKGGKKYSYTFKYSLSNAAGEGASYNGINANPFVITSAGVNASGSSTLTIP